MAWKNQGTETSAAEMAVKERMIKNVSINSNECINDQASIRRNNHTYNFDLWQTDHSILTIFYL